MALDGMGRARLPKMSLMLAPDRRVVGVDDLTGYMVEGDARGV